MLLRLASRYNWCTCCDDDDDDDASSGDEQTMNAAEESRVDEVYRCEDAMLRDDEDEEDYKQAGYTEDGSGEEIKNEDYEKFERLRANGVGENEEFIVNNMEESLL